MLDCYCMHVTSTGSRLVVLVVHISMHFFIFFTLSEIRKLSYTSGALSCRSPVFRSIVVGVLVFFETIYLILTTILAFIFTIFYNTFPDSYYNILLQHQDGIGIIMTN